jgi:hypothetical protein
VKAIRALRHECAFSSVLEDRPADCLAPGLVREDKCPNLPGKSIALPFTFDASGTGVARARCSGGLDCIGGGTEIVLRHVAYTSRLSGGIGGIPRGPHLGAGRSHRVSAVRPGVHHLHIPTSPRARRPDRVPRASVRWLAFLEQMQNVFRAVGSPQCQELMIRISERPATMDRDQARVADLGEDHANQRARRASGISYDLESATRTSASPHADGGMTAHWRTAGWQAGRMSGVDDQAALLDEVAQTLAPLAVVSRRDGDAFVAELVREDGTILWPNYAHGPSEVLATLAAEQRFLVEDRASGSVAGVTYLDKARERLRRWQTGP